MYSPQTVQEVETLLGLLGDGAYVEGPDEVTDVNTKELGALDDLHWVLPDRTAFISEQNMESPSMNGCISKRCR